MDVAAGRCGKWAVPARIGGKLACLKDDQRCAVRLGAQYGRYGFVCVGGFLLTRWDYLRARPLVDRRVAAGEPCPVTTQTGRANSYPGLGPGPAYPMGTNNVITMPMPPTRRRRHALAHAPSSARLLRVSGRWSNVQLPRHLRGARRNAGRPIDVAARGTVREL